MRGTEEREHRADVEDGAAGELVAESIGGAHRAVEVDVNDGFEALDGVLGGAEVDAGAVDQRGDRAEGGSVLGDLLGIADIEPGVAEAGFGGCAGLNFGLGGAGDDHGLAAVEFGCPVAHLTNWST